MKRIEPHKRALSYPEHMPNDWLARDSVEKLLTERSDALCPDVTKVTAEMRELEKSGRKETPEYDRLHQTLIEYSILRSLAQDLRFAMLDSNPHTPELQRRKVWYDRFGRD